MLLQKYLWVRVLLLSKAFLLSLVQLHVCVGLQESWKRSKEKLSKDLFMLVKATWIPMSPSGDLLSKNPFLLHMSLKANKMLIMTTGVIVSVTLSQRSPGLLAGKASSLQQAVFVSQALLILWAVSLCGKSSVVTSCTHITGSGKHHSTLASTSVQVWPMGLNGQIKRQISLSQLCIVSKEGFCSRSL